VKIKAYPTYEGGGMIWAYMGPADKQPAPPDYEWMRAPPTHRHVSKTFEACNYLQALEGGLDTAHSSFVHNNKLGDMSELRNADTAPTIGVEHTDYGYCYTSTRRSRPDRHYMRIYQYIMPTQQMRGTVTSFNGGDNMLPHLDGHIWAPIDDVSTNVYNVVWAYDHDRPLPPEYIVEYDTLTGRGPNDFIPGTFRLKANLSNDYFIDRQVQKTQTFTGITGVNTQDYALQEGMGPIVDRSQEFLGTSDRAIVAMRRMMLDAVRTVERGEAPKGADPATHRGVRPYDSFIKPGEDWRTVFAAGLAARF
jgi:phenylpropionate dioxygenase-like ring-hydroxylating dioxygenase large terminal subunit